jgi:hypothetical protein
MRRLIAQLIAILVVTALVGVPAVQAAIAMPHDTAVTSTLDHPLASVQARAPAPIPCNDMMPGCVDLFGCGPSAILHTPVAAAAQVVWILVTCWTPPDLHRGLFIKPDLGPPRMI